MERRGGGIYCSLWPVPFSVGGKVEKVGGEKQREREEEGGG